MTGSTTTADNQLLVNVQTILDGLKKTADGAVLHSFIERGLSKFGATRIEAAFLAFVEKLLVRYLNSPDSDPGTRIKIKVIQQRLRPYLAEIPARPAPAATARIADVTPAKPAPDRLPKVRKSVAPAAQPEAALINKPTTAKAVLRHGESLPEQLAHQMADALTRSHDFDALLQTSLLTLDQGADTPDVTELKRQLKNGIEELISEHRTLEKNLTETRVGLQVMAEDRRQMEKALDHARKSSLTDELTGLPNRSAFLRQLDAEIGRAQRYGFSLALALIDLDDLKTVNERHGYAAGDAILHTYAREIMSLFRGYDLVARYGDDEFAVLLPNTQKDGAVRAIDKAQKHAAGTFIQFNGQNLPLPSFSSVLTLYSHGEPPEALLKRADEALHHAKLRGRAQSVVALAAN